jgi:hypothetical protein
MSLHSRRRLSPSLLTATWPAGERPRYQLPRGTDARSQRLRAVTATPVELPDADHPGWDVLLRALGVRD